MRGLIVCRQFEPEHLSLFGICVYEEFYNLLSKPFSVTPDASCFFMSRQHAEALATVQYSLLTSAGLTLVTGESGVGKTVLIRRVMSNLDDSVVVGSISNTHSDFGSILPWIVSAFELRSSMGDSVEMYGTLKSFLTEQTSQERRVVLIIDEAQNLSQSALEEVRLLTNLNTSDLHGIQVVLVGQPSLDGKLEQDSMKELAQRVALDFRIDPLDFEDTDEYITYRLSLYGGKPELFDYVARACIYYHSHGIPRLINSVCDLALVYGFGDSLETIDFKVVKRVLLSKKVSMSYFNRLERSRSAVDLHAAILASHGVDIARFSTR